MSYIPKDRYLSGERPEVGDRVEAGKGEDHDVGRVVGFEQRAGADGLVDTACVAWSAGVRTDHPIYDLTLVQR